MQAPQNVAIFGATGTAGRATATALRDAGHRVFAFGRRPCDVTGVANYTAPLEQPEPLAHALRNHKITALVSCLASRSGTSKDAWAIDHDANLVLLQAAQQADLDQFVLLSAICVQKPRLAFQEAKLAFEHALISSGLTYSIVRPTALFKSLSGQVDRLKRGRPFMMFGDGRLTACKPISDGDLGRYITTCLTEPSRQNVVLPVGGPGPALTPVELGGLLFDALDRPPAFRRVPAKLLLGAASALDIGGAFIPQIAVKAELARIGYYYATESMLVWDAQTQRYDADATPEYGTETIADFYAALARGTATVNLGDHAVF